MKLITNTMNFKTHSWIIQMTSLIINLTSDMQLFILCVNNFRFLHCTIGHYLAISEC